MKSSCIVVANVFLLLASIGTVFGAKTIPLEKLRIRNQIPGWIEVNKSFRLFNAKSIFEIINGGATDYIDNGMRKGFFQQLRHSDSTTIELFAEDFISTENARKMLKVKQASLSQSAENPDTATTIINEILGGVWACGIVGPFYFEFTVMRVHDNVQARTVINTFFEYYRTTGNFSK